MKLKSETTRGQGPGGQHRNTTDSTVVITHESTGIKVVRMEDVNIRTKLRL
jgi:protein subunit release factor B